MVTITAKNGEILNLGHQGENRAVTVRFPIADWQEWYGDGEASLINKRTKDHDGYPCNVTVNGGYAYWEVTNADTAYKGKGECQLIYTVNGVRVKTSVYQTFVDKSLGESEDPPAPWQGWVDKVNDTYEKQKMQRMDLQSISEYLYYIEIPKWDYEEGIKYYEDFTLPVGTCSSVRKGDLYGRNYDWFYDKSVSFIVHTKAINGRHASIGVAGGNSNLTKDIVQSGEWNDAYNAVPFFTVDGINDAGVVCNVNVVPSGDKGNTTGTNPNASKSMNEFMLVRYVLDYADSAIDAINKIEDINWYAINSNSAAEVHFMIADESSTYIVEFVDNKIVVFSDVAGDEYPSIPNAPIMTNFYIDGWDGYVITGFDVDGGIDPEDTTLTPHAGGLERYSIIHDEYENIESAEDLINVMKEVRYTNAGSNDTDPFWYSELVGDYEDYGDLTVYQNKEAFEQIKERWIGLFANRKRDGKTWHTVHTSVYDINKKTLTVIPQENDADKVEFRLVLPGRTIDSQYDDTEIREAIAIQSQLVPEGHPIVGSIARVAEVFDDGTFRMEWIDDIGGIDDVVVDGTSVIHDGIADIPYASSSSAGVTMAGDNYGLTTANSKYLCASTKTLQEYKSLSNQLLVGKGTLENIKADIVRNALTDASSGSSYTETQKQNACDKLGAVRLTKYDNDIESIKNLLSQVNEALKNGDIDRAIDLLDTFLLDDGGLLA